MSKPSILKFAILLAVAILWTLAISPGGFLSLSMLALAAVPMRVAWKTYGRAFYWLGFGAAGTALVAAGLPMFGMAFLLVTLVIGAHAELETHTATVFSAGLLALMITSGLASAAAAVWMHQTRVDLRTVARTELESFQSRMQAISSQASMNVDALVNHIPSLVIVTLMLSLAAALIWERRAYNWFRLPKAKRFGLELTGFRVPDVFVWITMLALLGAFLQYGLPWVEVLAENTLYVVGALYLFQGLAIVACFFRTFKVAPFWQGAWYILIAVQMSPAVSLLGFADYWLDFRERLAKKTTEINKSF